jgi:arylsulfatase
MCRFQIPGQVIAKYIPTFIEYPPMQAGASFNVSDLRALSVSKLAALVCKP